MYVGTGFIFSRALVFTLKSWFVSMVCRLFRLEFMAFKWLLSSVLVSEWGR